MNSFIKIFTSVDCYYAVVYHLSLVTPRKVNNHSFFFFLNLSEDNDLSETLLKQIFIRW